MITVSRQQALSRWDNVPQVLREALASDQNASVLQKICQDEHLPEDKIRIVSRLTGYVFLGFIHPEELVREIKDATGLNEQLARSISDAVQRRLFAPLLPEITASYAPPGQEPKESEIKTPAMIKEIQNPTSSVPISGIPVFRSTVPTTTSASKPAASEAAKPGAGPVFLHRESLFEPIKQKVEFKLEFPGEEKAATRDIHPAPHSPSPLAWLKNAAPAPGGKIMIKTPPSGQTQNPLPPSFGKTDTTPKVVHYNEGKSAIESLRPAPKPAGVPIADLNAPKDKPAFTPITPLIKKDEIHPAAVPQKAPFPPANLPPMSSSPKPMAPPAKPVSFVPPPPPPLIKSAMLPRPIAPPSPFNTKAPVPPPPPKPGFTPGPKRIDLTSL